MRSVTSWRTSTMSCCAPLRSRRSSSRGLYKKPIAWRLSSLRGARSRRTFPSPTSPTQGRPPSRRGSTTTRTTTASIPGTACTPRTRCRGRQPRTAPPLRSSTGSPSTPTTPTTPSGGAWGGGPSSGPTPVRLRSPTLPLPRSRRRSRFGTSSRARRASISIGMVTWGCRASLRSTPPRTPLSRDTPPSSRDTCRTRSGSLTTTSRRRACPQGSSPRPRGLRSSSSRRG
mmetsp:Transcript_59082/g.144959  ORF Transcript_59082/g.144959 Transcript_59082/m.144959 type:complete len:229 (+) Transcript_59082:155-841(+)